MRLNRTPIDVLFDILDGEFDLDKRTVSKIVLANREVEWGQGTKNGRAMANNLSNRRLLTDNVSNALPGSIPREALDDLAVSMPELLKRAAMSMTDEDDARSRYEHVCEVLLHEYPDAMVQALEDYACCSDIFDNVLDAIRDLPFSSTMDRARTALALYVTTGYLGDPYWAANLTVQYCSRTFGVALLEERKPEEAIGRERAIGMLGLQRIFKGGVRGRRHTLDPEGTVIGMLPEPEGSFIADVNNSVSAEHLRIWRGERGRWFAEGLGSLYGTKLARPGVKELIVIEPPLGEDGPVDAVEIRPGDVLALGSTHFEVQLFDRGE